MSELSELAREGHAMGAQVAPDLGGGIAKRVDGFCSPALASSGEHVGLQVIEEQDFVRLGLQLLLKIQEDLGVWFAGAHQVRSETLSQRHHRREAWCAVRGSQDVPMPLVRVGE